MTSPLASRLTQRHRRDLQQLTGLVGRQTRSVLARADLDAVAQWWTGGADREVERAVRLGYEQATRLTVRYLLEHARLHGAEVDPLPGVLDVERVRGSLFVVGVGAYLTSLRRYGSVSRARRTMVSGVVGSVHRFVMAGDRDTVLATMRAGR